MRRRDLSAGALVAVFTASLTVLPLLDRLDGLSLDSLFWLRHQVYGPLRALGDSPVVVVAVDEETYRRPPFAELPKAMWTPQLAEVLSALLQGGAKVVGQDLILPTSVERFLRGYDRDYLRALRAGAAEGRVVLGKVQHQAKPIAPFPGYSFAVGHAANIRLLNLYSDPDAVIRRVPTSFEVRNAEGARKAVPSMAVELAARALAVKPVVTPDRGIRLGAAEIAGTDGGALLLNFETGPGDIPVYSFADLQACGDAGDSGYFTAHFAGKVVLIGALLDVEDRKLTSKRFVTASDRSHYAPRCRHPVMEDLYDGQVVRDSVAGTLVLATAVNNILRQEVLRVPSRPALLGLMLVLTLAAAAVALRLRPLRAGLWLLLGGGAWLFGAVLAFRQGIVLPLFDPILAAGLSFALLLGYRFAVADREKRSIRNAFAYYLPAPEIDRILARDRMPTLGGETRELTVFFSDLAGFTALCEGLSPAQVVRLMNRYFAAMTEVIEAHGGFVDKYIGDAVVAVFGAPLENPRHAEQAVRAALACQVKTAAIAPDLGLPPGRHLETRIGLNSGPALIGNIGSKRRFNYTVMGDAVNLASRLEGANKIYGSQILISAATARACGDAIACRPLEPVRVLGRLEPVLLYEPLAAGLPAAQADRLGAFKAAQADMTAGEYDAAAAAFESLSESDPTAGALAARCRDLAAAPPGSDPVRDLDRK